MTSETKPTSTAETEATRLKAQSSKRPRPVVIATGVLLAIMVATSLAAWIAAGMSDTPSPRSSDAGAEVVVGASEQAATLEDAMQQCTPPAPASQQIALAISSAQ